MGSLAASGIPVVTKTSTTYRKFDIKILETTSKDDSEVVVTDFRPELSRTISSGSAVRDDGSVDYFEDLVYGIQFESRSSSARVARDGPRDLKVPTSGANETIAKIPPALEPTTPQKGWAHTGNKVVGRDSTDDSLIERHDDTGAFD